MGELTEGRAQALLDQLPGHRVLVVGDAMLDRYVAGRADRVSPEGPVPVVRVEEQLHVPGGAANVATNLTALGVQAVLVACVGDDAAGGQLLSALEGSGVDTSGVVVATARPTTVKTRVVAQGQQIVRFDIEEDRDVSGALEKSLIDAVEANGTSIDAVVVQDYDKGVMSLAVIATVQRVALKAGVPLIVDPKARRFFDYSGVTVFKPNERELGSALGEAVRSEDEEWMSAARARLGCAALLVTRGRDGIALHSHAEGLVLAPTAARAVFDVSGAGDTVSAAMAAFLSAGATLTEAAHLANHAAAVEVGKPGVATVDCDELRTQLRAPASRPAMPF